MKLTILLCSLLFAAIATKDVYVEGATTDSPGAAAVDPAAQLGVNEAASYMMYFEDAATDSPGAKIIKGGSGPVPTPSPKNCDALTDRKACKKKDQKEVTSNLSTTLFTMIVRTQTSSRRPLSSCTLAVCYPYPINRSLYPGRYRHPLGP